jgi:hypothetical protein
VGGLTALTYLDLDDCNVVAAGLRELRHLTQLTALNLCHCSSVTDAGLRELRVLTALTRLYLNNCRNVTNVGIQELSSLSSLNHLSLYGCSTSKAGQNALKAAIPGLIIYARSGVGAV